jgi:hypothetical protein
VPSEPVSVEEELALRLCGIADRREREAGRIDELARRADCRRLTDFLFHQRVFALVGSRLRARHDEYVPRFFSEHLEQEILGARRRFALHSHHVQDLAVTLEAAGIEAVALKGPLMAERIYEDPGLRATPADLDFLVRAERLDDAVDVLRSRGYKVHDDTRWAAGLPHYHYGLAPADPLLPKVELHWRVHWYETRFAPELIDRSVEGPHGIRIPRPVDEIGALLAMYGRDGFVGLRAAADLAAWWDRFGDLLPLAVLEPLLERHPRLREVWSSALITAEQVVGLPGIALAGRPALHSSRARRAARMGNWRAEGGQARIETDVTTIDLVLTPAGAWRTTLRHYFAQPIGHYARTYGWSEGARVLNELKRALHVCSRMAKSLLRLGWRLWVVRGGRALHDTLPRPAGASPIEPVGGTGSPAIGPEA